MTYKEFAIGVSATVAAIVVADRMIRYLDSGGPGRLYASLMGSNNSSIIAQIPPGAPRGTVVANGGATPAVTGRL